MKRYVLRHRSACLAVLYPKFVPFDVRELMDKLTIAGVQAEEHANNGMYGVRLTFPQCDGAVTVDSVGGSINVILETRNGKGDDAFTDEVSFQLPFSMFHNVSPLPAVVNTKRDAKVSPIPGATSKFRVALNAEDNMKIYCYGAFVKAANDDPREGVIVHPRHATYHLHVYHNGARVHVETRANGTNEVLAEQIFKMPGALHRHMTSVLQIAARHQGASQPNKAVAS